MDINIPSARPTCDCEKFAAGFSQLCKICHLADVRATRIGVQSIIFKDGSEIGMFALFKEAGIEFIR